MKKQLAIILVSLLSIAYAQKVGVLNGPSGIPCGQLIEEKNENGLNFEIFASAQTELPKLLKGEIDIGFLPPNAAAKVYNTTKGNLVTVGIAGNGNLFLISKDEKIKSLKNLSGKTVACAGQGATPEYMIRYLLSKNGVKTSDEKKANKKSVTLDFSTPNPQIAAALIEGKFDYALVPEPFATVAESKDPSIKRVLNIQKEFEKSEKIQSFPMTLIVVNSNYAKANPDKVEKFINIYEKASSWTRENPQEAGKSAEKANIGLQAKVAEKAIPNAAFTWKRAKEGKAEIEKLLSIFLDFAPESIGGKLPDEGFYY